MRGVSNWVVVCIGLATATVPRLARAQTPLTFSIRPIGGTVIEGGQLLTVEVFLTANVAVSLRGGQIDLPCNLPGLPGSTGTISVESISTDVDGDGVHGPSSTGIPFLFPGGLGPVAAGTCLIATTMAPGGQPVAMPAGRTRYLGTYFYLVSDCVTGTFQLDFECRDQPEFACDSTPEPTNTTRMLNSTGTAVAFTTIGTSFSVGVGQCCRGTTCLGTLNEQCCLEINVGTSWVADQTCADECPCRFDADCNDRLFCTQDSCVDGACNNVEDPGFCDDGNDCTLDRCNNPLQRCDYELVCVYGDIAPDIRDCVVDDEDLFCALDGFAMLSACMVADVYPCLGDDDINFDDVLALMAASGEAPACPDPPICN